jgi:hypothetical protein
MKNYRIVEESNLFYPQKRFMFFFWENFKQYIAPRISMNLHFKSLEECEVFLTSYHKNKTTKVKPKIHIFNETKNP